MEYSDHRPKSIQSYCGEHTGEHYTPVHDSYRYGAPHHHAYLFFFRQMGVPLLGVAVLTGKTLLVRAMLVHGLSVDTPGLVWPCISVDRYFACNAHCTALFHLDSTASLLSCLLRRRIQTYLTSGRGPGTRHWRTRCTTIVAYVVHNLGLTGALHCVLMSNSWVALPRTLQTGTSRPAETPPSRP